MSMNSELEGTHPFITKLNTHDVLCGRGSGPNDSVGNINFRNLVATRKPEYKAIGPKDYFNKNRIAKEIIETVRSRGGRFLKRAEASILEGEPEPYELVDEQTVVEKAKQALRKGGSVRAISLLQGKKETQSHLGKTANDYAESQPSMMMQDSGVARPPPPSDPYQAFMAHLQQASMQQQQSYGVQCPTAGMAAQQQAYYGAASEMPQGIASPRDAFTQQQQQHTMPTMPLSLPTPPLNIGSHVATSPNPTSSTTRSSDVEMADYSAYQQGGAGTDHAAASILLAMEQIENNSVSDASSKAAESYLSDTQMRALALENLSVSSSQKKPACDPSNSRAFNGGSISQHRPSNSRTFSGGSILSQNQPSISRTFNRDYSMRSGRSTTSEPFIEGLDDMSLPSMSIGEISDLTWQERVSLSRAALAGQLLSTQKEMDREHSSHDSSDPAMKLQDIIAIRGSSSAQGSKEYDPNRHVSFLGSEHSTSSNERAQKIPRPKEKMAMNTSHAAIAGPSHLLQNKLKKKKKKRSLSSYYREMKNSSVGGDEAMPMSQESRGSWPSR